MAYELSRQRWMAVLARAGADELDKSWQSLDSRPGMAWLRRPETGLVMLQGRAGGDGQRFNVGEMTVTRCAVRCVQDGRTVEGHAYVKGRDKRQCELAARFDALLQLDDRRDAVLSDVVQPLADAQAARKESVARKAAATKVDFFTLVRGHS